MPCSACPCGTRAAIRVLIERGALLDHDRQKVVCAAVTVSTYTVRLLGPPPFCPVPRRWAPRVRRVTQRQGA